MFSVAVENTDCFDSGVVCRKSLHINVGRSFIVFDDDSGEPVSRFYLFMVWHHGLMDWIFKQNGRMGNILTSLSAHRTFPARWTGSTRYSSGRQDSSQWFTSQRRTLASSGTERPPSTSRSDLSGRSVHQLQHSLPNCKATAKKFLRFEWAHWQRKLWWWWIQGRLSGLCGNFDAKTVNEMRTPDYLDSPTSQEFGNSWTAVEVSSGSSRSVRRTTINVSLGLLQHAWNKRSTRGHKKVPETTWRFTDNLHSRSILRIYSCALNQRVL